MDEEQLSPKAKERKFKKNLIEKSTAAKKEEGNERRSAKKCRQTEGERRNGHFLNHEQKERITWSDNQQRKAAGRPNHAISHPQMRTYLTHSLT
mmetsp:Transcript_7705/g.15014  ORF Transcript_7705/g.15014 Transcript_7705/m.15014 type:complete len:94 (-) Transcript_7705:64-345(-)